MSWAWAWQRVRVERRVRTGVGRTWPPTGRSSDGEAAPTGSAAARAWGPGLRRSHPAMAKQEEGRLAGRVRTTLGM